VKTISVTNFVAQILAIKRIFNRVVTEKILENGASSKSSKFILKYIEHRASQTRPGFRRGIAPYMAFQTGG